MLDTQINLYSVDTGHFYSGHEKYLHDMNCRYRRERNYISNQLPGLEKQLMDAGLTKEELSALKKDGSKPVSAVSGQTCELIRKYCSCCSIIKHKQDKAKQSGEALAALLANRVRQNEQTNGRDHIRTLRHNDLHDNNVISVFESALTRTIGIPADGMTDALIVVQVYYFDVFKDLTFYGFLFHGEKYRYYTSSAGQIRQKKAIFIKETVWNRIEKSIMCGLTIDKINAKGGINVNKHLAYMALANSATDEWCDFDIDKCIVIDDFETAVPGTFDYIDEADYSITRTTDVVPVTHTDGAGMVLPEVMSRNTMFRAPWIKGLLGVFDFRKFIQVNNCSPVITDIYGTRHDILAEDIQIIFTKSQFKMYNFYDSWDEYKTYFKKYRCQAGICNTEEERIKPARINYQMLQTLTDVTDEELDLIAAKSVERITNLCSSEKSMKTALGITPFNTNMTPFQKAVKLYPSLLNDTYTKDILREIKNSLLKKYRSGKLEIDGKYTFLLPDFYAACEYWFGHNSCPKGLLADKEVYCRLFKHNGMLDCLRSPHLYREHAIRYNTASRTNTAQLEEWFCTNALYTSSHDLISKLLQFDVDGDKSLVVADPDFVRIAQRNMQDIVPLYYNMRKAEPLELNSHSIYDGLHAAFTGGNIGVYSNDISKIWNSDVFQSGTPQNRRHALDCIKRLCCQNNFVIDYAKTLYKPQFPEHINKEIKTFTRQKLPAFFAYAKDKEHSQIEARNSSLVNRLFDRIPDRPLNTRRLKLDMPDYRKLMGNRNLICPKEVSSLYNRLNREYRYMVHMRDEHTDNLHYIACRIRDEFSQTGYSDDTIADMLVQYLYGTEKRGKQLFWFCYGQYAVNHLENSLEVPRTKFISCSECGEWIEVPLRSRACRCSTCQHEYRKRSDRERKRRSR